MNDQVSIRKISVRIKTYVLSFVKNFPHERKFFSGGATVFL